MACLNVISIELEFLNIENFIFRTIMAAKVQNVWISATYTEYRYNAKTKISMYSSFEKVIHKNTNNVRM